MPRPIRDPACTLGRRARRPAHTRHIQITSDDPDEGNFQVVFGATATDAGEIRVSRTSDIPLGGIDMLDVDAAGRDVTYTIHNDGALALGLLGAPVTLTPGTNVASATVTAQPPVSSLAPGASTTFTVRVVPSMAGMPFDTGIAIDNDDTTGPLDQSPFTFTLAGNAITNVAPTIQPVASSVFVGSSPYELSVDPLEVLGTAALEVTDAYPGVVDLGLSLTSGPNGSSGPIGITAPSPQMAAAVPTTMTWSGTVDSATPPGTYVWSIVADDGLLQSSAEVRITVRDLPPTHVPLSGIQGDGSMADPYTYTFTQGLGPSTSAGLATVSDPNTAQILGVTDTRSGGTASGGSGFDFTLASGQIVFAPAATLVADDVGTLIYDVVLTDGTNAVHVYVSIVVNPQVSISAPNDLAIVARGEAIVPFTILSTGGTGTVTYSVTGGTLPSGITIAADGTVSGSTSDPVGSYPFTLRGTDSLGAYTERQLAIVVTEVLAFATTSPLMDGTVGLAYDEVLVANGGFAPFVFSLAPGSNPLPPGVSLSTTGELLGTPTTPGTYTFTVRLSDGRTSGSTVDGQFAVNVVLPPGMDAGIGTDDGGVDGGDAGTFSDAGMGGTTGGGCNCTVAGSRSSSSGPWGLLLFASVLVVRMARRSRRARRGSPE